MGLKWIVSSWTNLNNLKGVVFGDLEIALGKFLSKNSIKFPLPCFNMLLLLIDETQSNWPSRLHHAYASEAWQVKDGLHFKIQIASQLHHPFIWGWPESNFIRKYRVVCACWNRGCAVLPQPYLESMTPWPSDKVAWSGLGPDSI